MYNYFVVQKYSPWVLLFLFVALNLLFLYRLIFIKKFDTTQTVFVSRIVDGSSFVAGLRQYRLAGAIAPEYPLDCLSTAARDRLQELILNKKVELKKPVNDKFGLTTAFIFFNNQFIDKIMLSDGLAKTANQLSSYQPELVQAESEAKSTLKGIWSSRCNPLSDCRIKGSFNSADNLYEYHLPDCPDYQNIEVNFSNGDRWFCSEVEAKKAKFNKSSDCPNN
jgi:endonuclease YncB( thermonuclease family)